jgi:hypothetical protein
LKLFSLVFIFQPNSKSASNSDFFVAQISSLEKKIVLGRISIFTNLEGKRNAMADEKGKFFYYKFVLELNVATITAWENHIVNIVVP